MEAYASVYEGYGKKKKGDCVSKSEKGDHNCAKKVCHEQYGEGETIFGQHAVPDQNGFVSHYDVQFEHGIVENVSVEDMDILTMEAHGEHVEHEGETISEMGMSGGKPNMDTRKSGEMGGAKPTGKPAPGNTKQTGKPSSTGGNTKQTQKPNSAGGNSYQLPKRTPQNAANVEYYKDDVDLFDVVKGYLMGEGFSEQEALEKMLTLTDEERTEIIEGSCMGDRKKKKKK